MITWAAAIVAGGRGARLGSDTPKQFLAVVGKPLIRHTLDRFLDRADCVALVVAVPEDWIDRARWMLGSDPRLRVIAGGESRTASSAACVRALAGSGVEAVLIHDAARPFVSDAQIDRLLHALAGAPGAVPALPSVDALKSIEMGDLVGADIDRAGVVAVQTPQAFRLGAIAEAFDQLSPEADWPDDAAVARSAGLAVALVPGEAENFKVTRPADLVRAEALLARPLKRTATGTGFDVHRLGAGDGLILCGVKLMAPLQLIGHSDADVGTHALVDAILGALGAGDIGERFPPSDPQWRGADSRVFLEDAARLAREAGAEIAHVDVTLICEQPKVKPHREAMRQSLAATLGVEIARVSVKATTTEGLGFAGRGEGIAAQAAATLHWR